MLKYLLLIPLCLFAQITTAQKLSDLSEGEILDIKAISEDVIMQYEGLLNIIADKNTARSTIQKSIDENLAKLFYNSTVKLQDDLNGTEKNIVMADASKYLSDFNLYYTKNLDGRSVKFTDIKVGEPKQGNYLYLQVTYTCTYTQLHNLKNTKLPSGKRTADLRIEKQNGEWVIRIIGIMMGNNPVPDFETKRKEEEQKAAEEKAKQEQLKKEQELAEAKRKEEEQAEKLAQKQAKQAKLDSMVAARKKITTKPKQPLPIYVAFDYNWLNTDQQKVQGRMGVSVFTSSIGVFFNGWKQHQDTPPTDYRTAEQLDIINYYLQLDANTNGDNTNYINTTYTESGAKLTTFNWGVYAPAIRRVPAIGGSVWAMGGLAHLKGNVWDIYEGNLNNTDNFNPINTYTPEGINQYAIDYTRINKADLIVGIAYVRPFVQAQIGYNNLLRNFFVSTGVNMPIKTKKVKQYKANKTNSANPKN